MGLNGTIFDREGFVFAIENGKYPAYTIASIDGLATPLSKADGVSSNNLGVTIGLYQLLFVWHVFQHPYLAYGKKDIITLR